MEQKNNFGELSSILFCMLSSYKDYQNLRYSLNYRQEIELLRCIIEVALKDFDLM